MSGSSMSPDTAAIIIGTIQASGSYLSFVLMERAGRRLLILVSCSGMSLCHLVVGVFCWLQASGSDVSSLSWLPVFALSVYMVCYCLGMGPAPFVVASEIFRAEVAGLANGLCTIILWSTALGMIKAFNPLTELVGIDGCFFLFSGFCAATFFFAYNLVPETKGRKREDIVDELARVRNSTDYYEDKIHDGTTDANNKNLIATEQV